VTGEEIDAVAEAVAAKITQGILRMPDDLRQALAENSMGYFSVPGLLMPGPNAYYLQVLSKPGGIELEIRRPDGSTCWRAVIM
jgi:hypothetical protein